MRFLIVCVGRPRDRALSQAIDEYESRAARYWPIETKEVREERARSAEPARALARRQRLLDACECAEVIRDATLPMASDEFAGAAVREGAR